MTKAIRTGIILSLGILIAVILLLLVVCYINHRIQLQKEDEIYVPIGKQYNVNGHNINVYTEGTGNKTLVFLSGGGTCSPVLDFKSLYSLLSNQYRIVVVERAGYGFSDDSDIARDADTILSETRQALNLAGIHTPYVLCPHSMSGIESLYWAQKYPDEISAIIGLDMAVPMAYESMKIHMSVLRLGQIASNIGVTRWIPHVSESDAIKHGTLTEKEKELYRAIFYRRTATTAMLNEAAAIKKNAKMVHNGATVTVPILMFASNGSGGTGYDKEKWRAFQYNFANNSPNAKVLPLDCPHYVHNYEYEKISAEIHKFLSQI